MNTLKRYLLGMLSSLLLVAGFVRAAGAVDPMTDALGSKADHPFASAGATSCGDPCDFTEGETL